MRLTIESVDLRPGATTARCVGISEEGARFAFAGDWRPCEVIAEALDNGEEVEVEVEPWQILALLG